MHIERCTEVRVSVQRLHTALVAEVPDAQRFVVAGRKHVLATGMEHDAPDPVVVTDEREQAQPGIDVPNPNRLISRSGREERALVGSLFVVRSGGLVDCRRGRFRRPGNAFDCVFVLPQFGLALLGVGLPDANRVII